MKRMTASLCARLAVVLTLAVAMASVGWAHRIAPVAFDESLSAYLSAGGTLAELCVDADGSGHASNQSCDACRLVDAASLPPADLACTGALSLQIARMWPATAEIFLTGAVDPSHPVRAPPVV